MKKKSPKHPRLYLSEKFVDSSDKKTFKYLSNDFIDNQRLEKEEVVDKNDYSIFDKNCQEYDKLNKFIKIQKIVLKKHKKDRNYDAENIVKSSINLMENFKKDFDSWFKKNKI
ncbi:MAG: hypothetical protein CMG14_05355 [Candidatus Marinimicrobia bacterium]|nr:hypothetical protein [Candidatus Neomarinimicrobiota bacterium]|tara:strand:+ start:12502 stop:12840 length:339 start_codon:yes stop_codon:yes gene_type:complete